MRYFLINRETGKKLTKGFKTREKARAAKRDRSFGYDIWDSQSWQVVR